VVLCDPTEASRDMRLRVLDAAAPGMANSPSWPALRGVLRCDKVDLRRDGVRLVGDCALVIGLPNEKLLFRSL
jgi:hypothetical protein